MNRSELVESVGAATGLDHRQAETAVKAVVDVVIAEIKSGGKVSIFGFGTFAPSARAARVGRNPQTGEAVNIAASTGVRFSPSASLKALLNPAPAPKKAAKKAPAPNVELPAKKAAGKKSVAKSEKKSPKASKKK